MATTLDTIWEVDDELWAIIEPILLEYWPRKATGRGFRKRALPNVGVCRQQPLFRVSFTGSDALRISKNHWQDWDPLVPEPPTLGVQRAPRVRACRDRGGRPDRSPTLHTP